MFRVRNLMVICALLSATSSVAQEGQYEYYNFLEDYPPISIIVPPSPISGIAAGDLVRDAQFCKKEDRFICVLNESFSFAVPRSPRKLAGTWKYNGEEYRIIRRGSVNALGLHEKVVFIESVQKFMTYIFVYSPCKGLLGFSATGNSSTQLYVLVQMDGFGAKNECPAPDTNLNKGGRATSP